jgi:hypothetical protein
VISFRRPLPVWVVALVLVALGFALGGCTSGAQWAGVSAGAVAPSAPPPTEALPTQSASPAATATPRPSATPVPTRPTATATSTGTATPAPIPTAIPATAGDAFTIGGIRLADGDTPLTLAYPASWEGDRHTVADIDLLVSDAEGRSMAVFSAIGSWLGEHKVFVYPDTASGRPVLSIHDGTYSGVPLEAEPLRQLIEGGFHSPFAEDKIAENLDRLEGERFTLAQGDAVAEFEVVDGVRMDAETTVAYRDRPGDISTLLAPLERPEDSFLILMCSTRQPDEPDEIFPARFVLALSLVR